MKPTVLLISTDVHTIPTLKGAAVEHWIHQVARHLHEFQPVIVSPPHPKFPDSQFMDGIYFERIRIGNIYKRAFQKITRLDPFPYIFRAIRKVRSYQPKIIHIHNAPHHVSELRHSFPDAKLILHMHNAKKLEIFAPADAYIACSRYIADSMQPQLESGQRFRIIPNGVDTNAFTPCSFQYRSELKKKYSIPANKINILFVGRISPEKGVDILVEAMHKLDQNRFHLTVSGEWSKGDPRLNERASHAAQVAKRLHGLSYTLLDVRPPELMPEIYQTGDLMVIPSRHEPFSMVAIEGMSSRIPVLAFSVGGMVEFMRDGKNAFLIPPVASYDEMAQAIQYYAQLPEEQLANITTRARADVLDYYTWSRIAEETETLYQNLLTTT